MEKGADSQSSAGENETETSKQKLQSILLRIRNTVNDRKETKIHLQKQIDDLTTSISKVKRDITETTKSYTYQVALLNIHVESSSQNDDFFSKSTSNFENFISVNSEIEKLLNLATEKLASVKRKMIRLDSILQKIQGRLSSEKKRSDEIDKQIECAEREAERYVQLKNIALESFEMQARESAATTNRNLKEIERLKAEGRRDVKRIADMKLAYEKMMSPGVFEADQFRESAAEEIEQAKAELVALDTENEHLKQMNTNMEKGIRDKQSQISATESDTDIIRREIELKQQDLEHLNISIRTAEEKYGALANSIDNDPIKEVIKDQLQKQKQMESALMLDKQRLQNLTEDIDEKKMRIEELKEEEKSLRNDITVSMEQIATLSQTKVETDKLILSLKETESNNLKECSEKQQQIKNLRAEIDDSKHKLRATQSKKAAAEMIHRRNLASLSTVPCDIATVTADEVVKHLNDTKKACAQELISLEENSRRNHSQLQGIIAECNVLDGKINALQKAYDSVESQACKKRRIVLLHRQRSANFAPPRSKPKQTMEEEEDDDEDDDDTMSMLSGCSIPGVVPARMQFDRYLARQKRLQIKKPK